MHDLLSKVTYHAIFRYLERVLGLPVDAVRELILSKPVQRVLASGFDNCVVRIDGFSYVISGGKVTTVLLNWMRSGQIGQGVRMKEQTRSQIKRDSQKANRRFKDKRKSIQRQLSEVD